MRKRVTNAERGMLCAIGNEIEFFNSYALTSIVIRCNFLKLTEIDAHGKRSRCEWKLTF